MINYQEEYSKLVIAYNNLAVEQNKLTLAKLDRIIELLSKLILSKSKAHK